MTVTRVVELVDKYGIFFINENIMIYRENEKEFRIKIIDNSGVQEQIIERKEIKKFL